MPKSILLTGSTGFVGTNLVKSLTLKSDYIVKSAVRHAVNKDDGLLFEVGDINASTDFELPLKNTTVVVHCAARAHVMDDKEAEPLTLYREVNTAGTVNLAKQAIDSGVKRFIFISSIKVNGEGTLVGCPFKTEDNHAPEDDYGLSKSES